MDNETQKRLTAVFLSMIISYVVGYNIGKYISRWMGIESAPMAQ